MAPKTFETDDITRELDRECEAWDWVRTAGISAPDLRAALREALEREALPKAA